MGLTAGRSRLNLLRLGQSRGGAACGSLRGPWLPANERQCGKEARGAALALTTLHAVCRTLAARATAHYATSTAGQNRFRLSLRKQLCVSLEQSE